jgi:predicted Zn-dependent peptidase
MTVRVTTLPNGLRVATDGMDTVETASLGVWVGGGTRHEAPETNGVAHLVEHMMFKGTPTRGAFEISQSIEAVGGHLNAYTTREHTAFYAKVLAEDSDLALDILSDILQHSKFDEEELQRERGVVLQEIGQAQDTPDDIVFDQFQEVAYPDQPLGRPVLGESEIVGSLTREDLRDYITRCYGADRMVVTAAGRIDHDAFVAQVESQFKEMPAKSGAAHTNSAYRGGRRVESRELEQVHLVVGFPGIASHDPDFYAHTVYSTLLGGGMSSRLFQEVREKRGLVYSIYSFSSTYADGGLFGIYAGTGPEEVATLVPVLAEQLVDVAAQISDAELKRAKAQLRAATLMARESTSARAETLAQQMLIFNRPLPTAELLEKLEAVTADDVRRIAGRRTEELAAVLGQLKYEEVIHVDNLVVTVP